MKYQYLSETVSVKRISEDEKEGVFEIEGLYTGYGITIGNALRRVLYSSLPGAAITQIKIKGVGHEFTTIEHVMEDVVAISLNFKKTRFRMHTDEPQILTLKAKGEKKVYASDIKTNSQVEVITPDVLIATLTNKNAELDVELTVEKGLGYVPVEARKTEKLPIGAIALDAMFSAVVKVNFEVENMRVEDRTDYNRVRLHIVTDGTISPSSALHKASNILKDHFEKVAAIEAIQLGQKKVEENKAAKPKKTRKKKEQ
ncbi:MAG: DNA-directed RNA polymerase subunit alpha [Parcubacteria group bacterium]|nr:DNA-directed RNA polymerase subunit alpha [Parcubacteria group bacterium]